MERRDRKSSIILLNELIQIDSLDYDEKGPALIRWYDDYMCDDFANSIDLELEDYIALSELIYRNMDFLKIRAEELKQEMKQSRVIGKFFT